MYLHARWNLEGYVWVFFLIQWEKNIQFDREIDLLEYCH